MYKMYPFLTDSPLPSSNSFLMQNAGSWKRILIPEGYHYIVTIAILNFSIVFWRLDIFHQKGNQMIKENYVTVTLEYSHSEYQ